MHVRTGYLPGCIGRIAELHGHFYAAQAGFGVEFEAKVATELSAFCVNFDPTRDGLWLAMEGDEVLGSVAIDGAGAAEKGAHLRWFIVAERQRGTGAGRRLLAAALAFCDHQRYPQVDLWTFDQLHAARHLYEQHGFVLTSTQRGRRWGTEVNEQRFVRLAG
jgi:GNAT superfamily N-acetyltransferase